MANNYHRWTKSELREIAKRYERWADLDREENLAAQAIRRHGLYDELCGHMHKRVQEISEEQVRAKANLCSTRVEFYRTYSSEYGRALHLGLMDDLGLPRQFRRHTNAGLKVLAAEYSSLGEFYRNDHAAYQIALRRGILEEICIHMDEGRHRRYQLYLYDFADGTQYVGITRRRDRHKWGHCTNGPVFDYAKEYFGGKIPEPVILERGLTKREAKRRERREIKARRSRGLRLLNNSNGGETGGSPYAHSEKSIRALASKYPSRVSFNKHESAAAQWARKHGIELDFPNDTQARTQWSEEEIWSAVSKCTTYSELAKRYPSAVHAAKRLGLLPQIQEKLPPSVTWFKGHKKYRKEHALKAAKKYGSLKEFREAMPALYSAAYRSGWLAEIEENGTVRGKRDMYSKTELADIAKGYPTRAAFQRASPSAYNSALKQGFLNEICAHMKPQKRNWDRETMLEAAKEWKGKTLSEFIKATGGLYNKAKKIGLWDEIHAIIGDKLRGRGRDQRPS